MPPILTMPPTAVLQLPRVRLPRLAPCASGPARIGRADGFADEVPPHWVDVPPFAIGIHPITNRDYAAFLADRYLPPPPYWFDPHLNHPTQPVVGVTWRDAVAYCTWLTMRLRIASILSLGRVVRLPTEIEWEQAAGWDPVRGQQRRYPWGQEWDATRAVTTQTGSRYPQPIGERPRGASAYGVHDMLGNVWEWTASVYASYPGAVAPFAEPDRYVLRGGSCALRPTHLRCSFRCRLPPAAWRYHLGFRVVMAAPL
ncbi:MAG: formylglycine-generating enzyme family protein [Roseiflexaceae bacterium]